MLLERSKRGEGKLLRLQVDNEVSRVLVVGWAEWCCYWERGAAVKLITRFTAVPQSVSTVEELEV